MESQLQYAPYTTAAFMLIVFPIVWAAIAGIITGRVHALPWVETATYKQVYAIVAHSAVLIALQQIFINPLNYERQSMSSPTTLAVFFPFLDDDDVPGAPAGRHRFVFHLVDHQSGDRRGRPVQEEDRTHRHWNARAST